MARRVLADFDAELRLRLMNRTDITAAMRSRFINDAYLMIANEFVHKEFQVTAFETLASGAFTLTPTATDLWWIRYMRDETHGRAIDQKDVEYTERDTRVAGIPTEVYWWGGVFYFNRIASEDISLKIWYKRKPVEIAPGASPEFDELFDVLIPMKAAKIGFETVGNQEQAHIQETMYRNYVATAKFPVYQNEHNSQRKGIRVRMK